MNSLTENAAQNEAEVIIHNQRPKMRSNYDWSNAYLDSDYIDAHKRLTRKPKRDDD